MLARRIRFRSGVVSLHVSFATSTNVGRLPRVQLAGPSAIYQSRCQSRRYSYAPSKNEPEPQAGSKTRRSTVLELDFDAGVGFFFMRSGPSVASTIRLTTNDGV